MSCDDSAIISVHATFQILLLVSGADCTFYSPFLYLVSGAFSEFIVHSDRYDFILSQQSAKRNFIFSRSEYGIILTATVLAFGNTTVRTYC